jgi:hypothetical protein
MANFALEPKLQQEVANPKRHHDRCNDAHHPGWEKAADHVNGGRSTAPRAQKAD